MGCLVGHPLPPVHDDTHDDTVVKPPPAVPLHEVLNSPRGGVQSYWSVDGDGDGGGGGGGGYGESGGSGSGGEGGEKDLPSKPSARRVARERTLTAPGGGDLARIPSGHHFRIRDWSDEGTVIVGSTLENHLHRGMLVVTAFGRGKVTKVSRPHDRIAEITLENWRLANGSRVKMYALPNVVAAADALELEENHRNGKGVGADSRGTGTSSPSNAGSTSGESIAIAIRE